MSTTTSSWQTSPNGLKCQWRGIADLPAYDAPWMHAALTAPPSAGFSRLLLALDWTRLSPLAGRGWFERLLGGASPFRPCTY